MGHLVIYTRSVHSPIIPLPPWTVLGVTGLKHLRRLLKCMNFNFVLGGRGKPRHSRIDNCKLTVTHQFPAKTKVHSVCCRRKVEPQKQPDKKKGRRPRKVNKRGIRALTRPIDKVHIDNVDFTVKQLTVNAGISHLASRETFSRYLNENSFKFLQSRKKGLLSTKDRSLRLKIARKMR